METLQEIQLHASKDHLVSDCGECSEFVLGWGGGVFQIVGMLVPILYQEILALNLYQQTRVYPEQCQIMTSGGSPLNP